MSDAQQYKTQAQYINLIMMNNIISIANKERKV
jgi:hypothetical protein